MKNIFIKFLLILVIAGASAHRVSAQEELTQAEKEKLQSIEDHGFLEAIYEIFYFHRLVLSHDYKNFQEESGKLEELQVKFKEQTGVNFYSRGHLVAPDFWPRVFRRDEPYAEQFPAIEFLFPLKEVDGGYLLDIDAELFLGGENSIGCLSKERLEDIEKYINDEFLKGKKKFSDDDEAQEYLNKMYDALFEKMRFFIKSDISDKKVCVGQPIDLGEDLKNFKLSDNQSKFNWNDGKGNQFDGLEWETNLTKPTLYTLTISDPSGASCTRKVTVSMKDNCEKNAPSLITCQHPVSNKKIVINTGGDKEIRLGEFVKLGGEPTVRYEDGSSVANKLYLTWKLGEEVIANEANPEILGLAAGDNNVLHYKLIVEDRSIFYKDNEYFKCEASADITINYKSGIAECKNPANGKVLKIDPGADQSVCFDARISLAARSKSYGYNNGGTSSGNFKYQWIATNNVINNAEGSDPILNVKNSDVVILKVEDLDSPNNGEEKYFSCYAGFNIKAIRNFEPVYKIKLAEELLHEEPMSKDMDNVVSLCNGIHKLELQIKDTDAGACSANLNEADFQWSFKPYKATQPVVKTGKNAVFGLGDQGPRVETTLRYKNDIIATLVINRVGAKASRSDQSAYGFDDYKRDNGAKHISVKAGGVERVKIVLDVAEAASDFSITAGNGISLNASAFNSSLQMVEINAAKEQNLSNDDGIIVAVAPKKPIAQCNNILTLRVHPYEELNGCVNLVAVNSNSSYLNGVEQYLNSKVFNQAVIKWKVYSKNISSSESSSELNLSSFPNANGTDEANTIFRKSQQNAECGRYYIFLLDKNIKTGSASGLPYAIVRKADKPDLPGDVLFLNVNGYQSQEKMVKVISYYLGKLLGLPDIQGEDIGNLMYANGSGYDLRLEQWKALRKNIQTIDFSPPASASPVASGTWMADLPVTKQCSNYENNSISISYRKEVTLYAGGSISLSKVFDYTISPNSSIKPKESFIPVIAVSSLPLHLSDDINTIPDFKYTAIGQPSYDDLVVNSDGVYRYSIQIGDRYTCEAFTKVKIFDAVGEFEKFVKAKDHEGLAKLVVNKFREKTHSEIEKFRLDGIKLLVSGLGLVGDDDEEKAINDLLAYTPPDQSEFLIKQLCVNNLLQNIRDGIHGENYAQFMNALRLLIYNATDKTKFNTLSKAAKEKDYSVYVPSRSDPLMMFPWDHALLGGIKGPIYDELIVKDVCNFSIDYCYGYIKTYTSEPSLSDLCTNGDLRKQAFINCSANCTPQPIQLDPLELIGIQFIRGSEELNIKPGTILIAPAITLKFLLDKKFNHQLLLTAELMGLMISGGELAVAKGGLRLVIASADFGLSVAAVGIRSFRDEIWVLEGGKEWLQVWDQVEAMVGVVYAGRLVVDVGKIVIASPQLIKDLRKRWNIVKSENPQTFHDLPAEEVKKVEDFLEQAEKELDIDAPTVVQKIYKLGNRLGDAEDGVHKDVFVLADDPEKAIAILRSTAPQAQIQKEFDILRALEAKQFPVVAAIEVTTHEGKPALIMRRYKCEGSKNILDFQTSKYINQKTVESVENIRKLLHQHKVEIEDLQFLILEDGTAIIHDPLNMFNRAPTDISMSRIDYFLEFAYARLLPKEIVEHAAFKALSAVKKSELCSELNKFPDLLNAIKNNPELINTWNSISHLKIHRTNPNFLEAFKFVNESEGMKHHIFQGDISRTNNSGIRTVTASGIHHISAIDGGYARFRPEEAKVPLANGLYIAKVDLKDLDGSYIAKLTNNGESTFFPDAWDQQRVLEEIGYAYMNKVHISNDTYRGTSTLGFVIQLFIKDNVIKSAYPKN